MRDGNRLAGWSGERPAGGSSEWRRIDLLDLPCPPLVEGAAGGTGSEPGRAPLPWAPQSMWAAPVEPGAPQPQPVAAPSRAEPPRALPVAPPAVLTHRPPAAGACSFLRPGAEFAGTQSVASSASASAREDAWQVRVVIQAVDLSQGRVAGLMTAFNVPHTLASVVTFFEGEIVDSVNHGFISRRGAGAEIDLRHWCRFKSFAPLKDAVLADGGRQIDLAGHDAIYLRLKEKFFINANADSPASLSTPASSGGLTINGLYYACLDCTTGDLNGYYYDVASSPFQKLALCAVAPYASSSYEFR